MKTIKITLEYKFKVPDNTKIIKDDFHGIFIINEEHNINSKVMLEGYEMEKDERDDDGNLICSAMGYDGGKLSDFLYNQADVMFEKETIKLGNKELKYIID